MATLKDFLGFVINPPPHDPATTAMSDQVPSSVVTTRDAGSGTLPAADGVGGYTWIPSTGPGPPGPQGPAGPTGATGTGVPPGGLAGYRLAKNTAADYDTVWQPPGGGPAGPPGPGVPPGGTTGQELVKSANSDYATTWVTPPATLPPSGPAGGNLVGTYPNPTVAIPTVTALPASPVDGQETYYLADAANGVVWHLRYRAGSASAHKWEFVGGASLFAGPSGSMTYSGTAPAAITGGPSITIPLPGDYKVINTANAQLVDTTVAPLNMYGGTMRNGGPSGGVGGLTIASARWGGGECVKENRYADWLAGDVITVGGNGNQAGNAIYMNATLDIAPIRVG